MITTHGLFGEIGTITLTWQDIWLLIRGKQCRGLGVYVTLNRNQINNERGIPPISDASEDDVSLYCNETFHGQNFGSNFAVHRDGSGCDAATYKEGKWQKLGTFETFVKALEATIEILPDSKYTKDRESIDQLKYWLAEEKEKLAADVADDAD